MDVLFFFCTVNPWPYYRPPSRQPKRFPSVSRGRIYEDSPLYLPERHETTTPTGSRDHYPSASRSSRTASLARHDSYRRRASSTRLPPLSRAMQTPSPSSSRPSLTLWPFGTTATAAAAANKIQPILLARRLRPLQHPSRSTRLLRALVRRIPRGDKIHPHLRRLHEYRLGVDEDDIERWRWRECRHGCGA